MKRKALLAITGCTAKAFETYSARGFLPFGIQDARWSEYTLEDAFLLRLLMDAASGTDQDSAALLARVRSSLGEMNALVAELLEFGRLESGGAVDRQDCDVAELVREAIDGAREQAEIAGVAMVVGPAGGDVDSSTRLAADERLLHRALSNLIHNAVRHAERTVAVTLTVTPGAVVVDVDDDGAGVPSADRELIFEPFTRLGDEQRRGSAGLGLAIAQRAVEAHGGTLTCLDAPIGGARFRLHLPRTTGSNDATQGA